MSRRILNIRPVQQAEELSGALRKLGMQPLTVPMLETVRVSKREQLVVLERIRCADQASRLVFTSANGVRYFIDCLDNDERLLDKVREMRCAVIGEKTAVAAGQAGLRVEFVSTVSNSEALAEELADHCAASQDTVHDLILLRARIASEKLPQQLAAKGISSTSLPVYDSRCPNYTRDESLDLALRFTAAHPEAIDCIAATSSQALINLVGVLESSDAALENSWHEQFAAIPVAVIGPKTAQTASMLGMNLAIVAQQASVETLAESIHSFFAGA